MKQGEMTGAAERREGFLIGAVVGARLVDGEDATVELPGRRRAAIALADELLVELLAGGVDLRRLAGRWIAWRARDGFEADPVLLAALDHLREFDAPPTHLAGRSIAAVSASLPAALASASPRAMIAGAFHVSRMLDPDEITALCAVAVVVAASELLAGHRDFIAEVLAALRANDAPDHVVEAMRAIPRDPRTAPPLPRGENPDPVAGISWSLWSAYHRRAGEEVLREIALGGGVSPHVGAIMGALIGARDGVGIWPARWITEGGEDVVLRRGVARRLSE